MASEYLKWLARNEKPEQKRELTPKEKRQNWWYYHKWHVVLGIAGVLLAVWTVMDIAASKANQPDYQVAYIGAVSLPENTAGALETALAELGEDVNGDGQVLVRVNEYLVFSEDTMYMTGYGAQALLTAEMSDYNVFYVLMEEPERVQEQYELLAYPDGTIPEEGEPISEELWYSWSDCPVLTSLSLGDLEVDGVMEELSAENQELLSGLYIARRAVWESEDGEFENLDAYVSFWETLTEGAK